MARSPLSGNLAAIIRDRNETVRGVASRGNLSKQAYDRGSDQQTYRAADSRPSRLGRPQRFSVPVF
jgi:hypothetical protein